jgi:uncharacterized protein (DUF1501 family)
MTRNRRNRTSRLSRRGFLRGAAIGAAAVGVQPILSLQRAHGEVAGTPGKFLVIINLLGGNDGLNMVAPTHLSAYTDRRANLSLAKSENLPAGEALQDLDGNYKLHYKLAGLGQMWNANELHIVHKVSYPNPNQSHFTSQDIYSYGVRNNATDGDGRGWLGRFADEFCSSPSEPLGVVSVGVGRRRDFEAEVTAPLILSSVSNFKVDVDTRYRSDHELRVETVRETIETDPVPEEEPAVTVFSANKQAHELVDRVKEGTDGWSDPGTYPTHALGRYMRTVSQLLHGQDSFQTKVFYTGYGGFDTHSGQIARQETLMARLDEAVSAFRDDMVAKSKWNDCVVVVISEFGRRVFENGSVGTDHGHGNAFLVAGGPVRGRSMGGGMTGEITQSDLADNSTLPFGYDFRDIYANIAEKHLGLERSDVEKLFPDPDYTPSWGDMGVV